MQGIGGNGGAGVTPGSGGSGGQITVTANNGTINGGLEAVVTFDVSGGAASGQVAGTLPGAAGSAPSKPGTAGSAPSVALVSGGNGGQLTLSANSLFNLPTLNANGGGGSRGLSGAAGGSTILAAGTATNGGNAGNASVGGNGGTINLEVTTGSITPGALFAVNANGGAGGVANGVVAGAPGTPTGAGTAAAGGNGGNGGAGGTGGNINISATSGSIFTVGLSATGGAGGGGSQGQIGSTNGGAGGNGGNGGSGGSGGAVSITSTTGPITFSATTTGGNGANANVGVNGGTIGSAAAAGTGGAGGNDGNGGAGGNITATSASGTVTATSILTANGGGAIAGGQGGGAGGAGAGAGVGGAGGKGGNGTVGGAGGDISLTSTTGTIVLAVAPSANGSTGSGGGAGGNGGTVTTQGVGGNGGNGGAGGNGGQITYTAPTIFPASLSGTVTGGNASGAGGGGLGSTNGTNGAAGAAGTAGTITLYDDGDDDSSASAFQKQHLPRSKRKIASASSSTVSVAADLRANQILRSASSRRLMTGPNLGAMLLPSSQTEAELRQDQQAESDSPLKPVALVEPILQFANQQLPAANVVLAPRDHLAEAGAGKVHVYVEKGSAAFLLNDGHSVSVLGLHDGKCGDVTVGVADRQFKLRSGEQLIVSDRTYAEFEQANPLPQLGVRGVRTVELGNGQRVFLCEFSLPSAVTQLGSVARLNRSTSTHDRAIYGKILKNAVVMQVATSAHGPYARLENATP